MRNMSFCLIMSLVIITTTISCTSVAPVTKSQKTIKSETVVEASRRYPDLKSAIIKYKVSGMNKGTETVYIDNWGKREAIYKKFTTKMMGIDLERNFMTLITENGKWVYNIDLNSKTAIRMDNKGFKALQGNSGSNMDVAIGAVKIGTEEILGKTCDVWKKSYPYSMAWMWKGIALRKDQNVATMGVSTEAIEIQENVSIPEDKLIIPSDVKVKVLDPRALSNG
ncbi:MAG: hypothetical protein H8D23_27920 [Candidatus Brocadiales bacterium]|nr:hypothetical protein [Candidatus Brocadiales bacterium]